MEPTNTQTIASQIQPVISRTDAIISDMRINPEWMITLAFVFFLGFFGAHRFYNGKIGTGILMILTLGGLGIWITIDFIMVIFGKFTKKDGSLIPVRIPV